MRSLSRLLIAPLFLLVASVALGQTATDVNNGESKPIPGVGHHYIKMLNETVNPANGSLDVTIALPVPPSRALTLPFSIAYNSNGTFHLQANSPGSGMGAVNDAAFLSMNGWSYTAPVLSYYKTFNSVQSGTAPDGSPAYATCFYLGDFIFTDPAGGRHSLYLAYKLANQDYPAGHCQAPEHVSSVLSDTYGEYRAYFSVGTPPSSWVYVASPDGTVYSFQVDTTLPSTNGDGSPIDPPTPMYSLPSGIEDRNGNGGGGCAATGPGTLLFGQNVWVPLGCGDSSGRNAVTTSGFGSSGNTITVSGIANPYTVTWGTTTFSDSPSFSLGTQMVNNSPPSCGTTNGVPVNLASVAITAPWKVITAITLPNGQSYQFLYDATSGRLGKIIYPGGGWVKYTWGPNLLSDLAEYPAGCHQRYDTVAVTHRYVSYDGTNIALQQDFSYSTAWDSANPLIEDSKQTIVTTTDMVRSVSFQTVYNYGLMLSQPPPNSLYSAAGQIPLEASTVYKASGGSTLRTVSKAWYKEFLPSLTCETLDNGLTSGIFYSYDANNQLTDKKEYDYGAVQLSNCQTNTPPASPLRETTIAYQTFANTPLYPFGPSIVDKPSSVKVYQNGTLVAETDYSYDQTAVSPVTAIGHDDTNYGIGYNNRGNATTITRKCLQTCADSITTNTYDQTGQLVSVKDANNNTTQYSYADNYASGTGTPPGNTNTFVTRITRPQTNGVSHLTNFKYGYQDGQLRTSTDENGQSTTYQYNDAFARPTQINTPDGGNTTISYNDSPYNASTPSPSVTTTKAINSSTNMTTLTAFDGLGHTVSLRPSDPDCTSTGVDRTDTTYDGLARVYTVSNPYCSAGDSTYGLTTYVYDALGRTTQLTEPDGSVATSSYSGNCVTVTDEAGKTRQSCSDGLGRLTQVTEDAGTSPHLNYVTNYSYDALDNLLTVNQKGGTTDSTQWRPRAFVYDSLSRLTSATNPESGTVTYVYDANGNVTSKTSPGPNQDGFPGTGSAAVSGNEQSIAGAPATAGNGSVTFSGTLQSKQVLSQAVAGTGSVTVNGTLQSKQVQTQAATSGSGWVAINGSEQSMRVCTRWAVGGACVLWVTIYDHGTVSISVNGVISSVSYGENDTPSSIATNLANAINANTSINSLVSASGSSASVTITAKQTGSQTNYSLSSSSAFDIKDFGRPSFGTTQSGSTLTGGANATYTTLYDSGTTTITVNGHSDSASWSGSGTTSSSIASALASSINGDSGASVTASASGSTVSLTAKTAGASTNYSLSSSWTYDSSDFSSSSFTTSNSGSTLTGGKDAVYNTLYDSGTSTITVNGHADTVNWSGSGTTTSTIASALASAVNADTGAYVSASVSGSTVNLTAKAMGANTNYSISSSNTYDSADFSSASFSSSNSGSTLTGGRDAGATTYDSGNVWVTINSAQYSVGYGQNSSASSLASALASTISAGSLANASASGSSISITAKTNGSATNYSLSSGSSTSQSGSFSSPSFSVSVSGPSLTGGTDPGGSTVTANFLYDALNRLTQKSFSDGATPTVKHGYDAVALSGCTVAPPALTDAYPVGRRTAMCDGAGAESWSHDTMGRVLNDSRTTNGVTKSTIYALYLDGSINTITYPSGRVITYTLKSSGANTASRLLSVVDTANSINYATAASYTPAGGLSSFTNGASLISTHYYNSRLQPCRISVTTSGTPPANCTDLNNKGNVLDLTFGFNLGSADNGNVAYINNNKDNTRSQNFTYDALNRLATAQTQTSGVTIPNSNCWGLTFGYDPWGNLLSSTMSGPSGCGEPLPFNLYATSNNQLSLSATQLTGYCYDAEGNLALNATCPTGSFTPTYSYNAENQMTSTAGSTYIYDGDGKRVMKSSGASGTLYWYGMSSDPLDETDLAGNTNNSSFFEYVFFNGKRIARRDYQNNVNYYFSDHLGTSRVVTNSSGTILDDSDFYPFGGERAVASSSGNHYKFTGKERDSESGLDNFGARYDSSSLGRFMSPDPLMASAKVWDPQTWNRYSYARNNPLLFIDPTGMKEVTAEECQKDPHCVTLNVNVIYDQNTLKGLTDQQKADLKADFEKQLQYAKDEYGNADIHLDVTYTTGALTIDNGTASVSGAKEGALNVIVTDQVLKGKSGFNGTMAASFLPANSTDKQELAHEMAHHLGGDTQGWRAWVATHDPDYTGYLLNAILDVGNKSERIWMNTFDTHSGAFSHYPLASAFNNNARVFQKMIQPTTKQQ